MRLAPFRPLRAFLTGLVLGGVLIVGSTPAVAELGAGDEAPELELQDVFNTKHETYADLKGRLILLEIFATT